MSNTFITVSPVETLNRGRLYINQSLQSILSNFYSSAEPVESNISINGVGVLPSGMLYYTQTTAPKIQISDNTSFTSYGTTATKVNTVSYATTLISESYLQVCELVITDNVDYMYMVNNSASGLVQVGVYNELKETVNNSLHLNSVSASNYVRLDINDSINSTTTLANTNYLSIGNLVIQSNTDSYVTIGYEDYDDTIVLSSTTQEVFANSIGFTDTAKAYYQFNEVLSGASVDINCNLSTFFTIELIANTTISFSNSKVGTAVSLLVNNYDAYHINWPTSIKWPNGRPPTQIPSGSSAIYSLLPMPANIWYGVVKFGEYSY